MTSSRAAAARGRRSSIGRQWLLARLLPFPSTPARAGRLVVNLLVGAMLVVGVTTAATNWHLTDLKAYLAAAELLASGGNPFDVHLVERGLPYYYHYSPWFAAVFVPLTALPIELTRLAWSLCLVLASGAALVPLIRRYGVQGFPVAGLMGFLLLNLVAEGNVQPLLLAGLVWTLERRAGPVMVGVAASLKITPLLLALVYLGRGQWLRAAAAGMVAAMLVAPTLLFDRTASAMDTGGTGLFSSAPVLWALVVLAAVGITLGLARTQHGWLAAATAAVLALPRLLIFDISNLLVALPRVPRR